MYLLGLDIGTTNWKANLYDIKGNLKASSSVSTPTQKDSEGKSYYDPLMMWNIFCKLTKEVASNISNKEEIIAVSFASMAEAGLIIDQNGNPLSEIITWYDKRSMPQFDKLRKKIDKEEIFGITGTNLQYIFSVCKIMWLKDNKKEAFKKAWKWLCCPDYLAYKFTKVAATDYSTASRTALFDLKHKKWSKKILEAAGLNEEIMPKPFPSGTVIGKITPEAAAECGLTTATLVVLGGHDHVCGSLGMGLLEEGILADSMGTAESASLPIKDISNLRRYFKSGFSFGCYVYGDMYYAMSGLYYSSGLIEWLVREFYNSGKSKTEIYSMMIEDAKKSRTGSNGLFVFPHWMGISAPYGIRHAKGMMIGFNPDTTKSDMINATYEGLSYEYRLLVETIEKSLKIKLKDIKVIGGGSKNKHWLQIKSDILGRNLSVSNVPETVCFGAALLAGIGAKVIKHPIDFIGNFSTTVIKNDPVKSNFYKKEYEEKYLRIYKSIIPFWEK